VPEAAQGLNRFKAKVMQDAGYPVDFRRPDAVKFEVARSLGIPLSTGYNGGLSTENAGRIGGQIGGRMVKEMVRMAQQQLTRSTNGTSSGNH
jgi:hypothetical protein